MIYRNANKIRTNLLLIIAADISHRKDSFFSNPLKDNDASYDQEISFEVFYSHCSNYSEECESINHNESIGVSTKTMSNSTFSNNENEPLIIKERRSPLRTESFKYLNQYSDLIKKAPTVKVRRGKKLTWNPRDTFNRPYSEKRNTWHIQLKQ